MYYLFIDLPVPSDLWQVSHALFLHLFRISLFIWRVLTDFWEIRRLHPWSLACNLKINTWKRKFLLEAILFRFHVQLREGMFFFCLTNLDFFKQKRVSGKLVWCNFCFPDESYRFVFLSDSKWVLSISGGKVGTGKNHQQCAQCWSIWW